jgi:GxxExxY protein
MPRSKSIAGSGPVYWSVVYKGVRLECGYRIDLLVDGGIIVEIKSVGEILPIHEAQVLTYLRLTGARQR